MVAKQECSKWLRRSLQGNAVFSVVSGLGFLAFAKPIAEFIGLEQSLIVSAIGVSLLIFAAGLARNSKLQLVNLLEARLAVGLDVAWVVGSGVVIATGILTTNGNWAVAVIADIVLLFAIAQFVGLRRLARAQS